MQEIYNDGLSVPFANGRIKMILYLERMLNTTSMFDLPKFEAQFQQYGFQWMTTVLGKHSHVLVREFYVVYKSELKR